MTEQAIIKQSLNGMAQIINAIPGETYANKEAETLLIMQHRLPESDLKKQIEIYNAIFAKDMAYIARFKDRKEIEKFFDFVCLK